MADLEMTRFIDKKHPYPDTWIQSKGRGIPNKHGIAQFVA